MRFPDGESIREVQSRAVAEIEEIAEEHPKGKVCCVSHGDVIKLIAAHYLGVHIDLFQRIVIGPASVSVIALSVLRTANPRAQQLSADPRRAMSELELSPEVFTADYLGDAGAADLLSCRRGLLR